MIILVAKIMLITLFWKESNGLFQACIVSPMQLVEISELRNTSGANESTQTFRDHRGNDYSSLADIKPPFGFRFTGQWEETNINRLSNEPESSFKPPVQRRWVRVIANISEKGNGREVFDVVDDDAVKFVECSRQTLSTFPAIDSDGNDLIKSTGNQNYRPYITLPVISRMFDTFTFKGVAISASKSLLKWKSAGLSCGIPVTANFPNYDRLEANDLYCRSNL